MPTDAKTGAPAFFKSSPEVISHHCISKTSDSEHSSQDSGIASGSGDVDPRLAFRLMGYELQQGEDGKMYMIAPIQQKEQIEEVTLVSDNYIKTDQTISTSNIKGIKDTKHDHRYWMTSSVSVTPPIQSVQHSKKLAFPITQPTPVSARPSSMIKEVVSVAMDTSTGASPSSNTSSGSSFDYESSGQ